jgi:hypothetical protein
MTPTEGRRPAPCPLGVNGGEFPHRSVGQICDLAARIGAQFVELSVGRVRDAVAPAVAAEVRRRGLGIHVGAMVSELGAAFETARAIAAPLIVAVDDAIERADLSRRDSVEGFRRLVVDSRFQEDGYRGPVSLEPHLLPDEMAPAMEADAAFLRRAGWVR